MIVGRRPVVAGRGRAWTATLTAWVALTSWSALAPWAAAAPVSPAAVASAVEGATLIELQRVESPGPSDHRLAYRMLELVHPLAPDDEERARRMVEAAWGAGDGDLLDEATKRLIRLAPDDTVAQLRLITAGIEKLQTIDERLAVYDRFLGDGGARIDVSIRSRLALDAALLHRERGDLDAFADALTMAVELDETNKEACSLAVTYFAAHVNDPVGLFRLQLRLLRADPLDPNVHFRVASVLAAEGALEQASRFHANGRSILAAAGALSPQQEAEQMSIGWAMVGPSQVVDRLTADLNAERARADAKYQADLANDVPPSQLVPASSVHLDPSVEKIRLLAALSDLDDASVQASLAEFELMAQLASDRLQAPEARASDQARELAVNSYLRAFADLQLMRGIAGLPLDALTPQATALYAARAEWAAQVRLLNAWKAFRENDPAQAESLCQGLPATDPLVRMLRGLIAERQDRLGDALALFQDMVRDDPLGSLGSWARSRVLRIKRTDRAVTDIGEAIAPLAERMPRWIDEMVRDPSVFMRVDVKPEKTDLGPHEPMRLVVELTCLARGPMAVGSDRPIVSRMLLSPWTDGLVVPDVPLEAVVIEFDRRLRLMPLERLRAVVDVSTGVNAVIESASTGALVRQRWRLVQGFAVGAQGGLVSGPLCLEDETEPVFRVADEDARLAPADLAQRILTVDEAGLPGAVRVAAGLLYRHAAGVFLDDPAPVVAALAKRLETAGPLERAFMLATVPSAVVVPAAVAFDDAARRLAVDAAVTGAPLDRLTVAVLLLTRVTALDDPVLASARASDDAITAEIAGLRAGRLERGAGMSAGAAPGLAGLTRGTAAPAAAGGR